MHYSNRKWQFQRVVFGWLIFPESRSLIEANSSFSFIYSNSFTAIRNLRIFEYYKEQYLIADRQKGIQIIVPGLINNTKQSKFISLGPQRKRFVTSGIFMAGGSP